VSMRKKVVIKWLYKYHFSTIFGVHFWHFVFFFAVVSWWNTTNISFEKLFLLF